MAFWIIPLEPICTTMSILFKAEKTNAGILVLRWIYGSALKNMMKDYMNPGQKEEDHLN